MKKDILKGSITWITLSNRIEIDKEQINDPILSDTEFKFDLKYESHNYTVNIKSLDKIIYTGKIFKNGKECGTGNFILYSNEKGFLFKGKWTEGLEYECLIELNKS